MSDPMGAFGGIAVAEPEPLPLEETAPGQGRKPLVLALLGALAALVVGLGAYFLFFSGGSEQSAAPAPSTAPSVAPSKPAAPSSGPSTKTSVPPSFDGSAGRDPFAPLVVPPVTPAPGTGAAGTGAGAGTGAQPTSPTAGASITLVKIAPTLDQVDVKVGTTPYSAISVGETFASTWKLYAVFNQQCAGFLYGDKSVTACIGSPTTVS